MAGKPVPIAATGRTVGDNVSIQRDMKSMTQAHLSARMEELGRPMSEAAIRAIENGRRRIDVDDLTTLAVALGTSPASLLEPLEGETLTGVDIDLEAEELALWVQGRVDLNHLSIGDYWQNKAEQIEREVEAFSDADTDTAKHILNGVPEARWLKDQTALAEQYAARAKTHYEAFSQEQA